jgi:hypothetical protein
MSTLVTIQTTDGRIINGINYTLNPATLPINPNPAALTASMPGGLTMGTYHIKTPNGWEYIPASQIAAVLQVKAGVPL